MKQTVKVFISDLRRLKNNVIAFVIILGLIIVPSLYAWFNIAASWDPYQNTKGIKVAVANEDTGYASDLLPVKINMGDQVITELHANDQLGWVFTDQKAALGGVKSGNIMPRSSSAGTSAKI